MTNVLSTTVRVTTVRTTAIVMLSTTAAILTTAACSTSTTLGLSAPQLDKAPPIQAPAHDVIVRAGGAATVEDASSNAFGFPAPVLSGQERRNFAVGNSFFRQNWVEAPSSTAARDGLGPLFNARSCSSCHSKDGRSCPPDADEIDRQGLLVRIGVRVHDAPDAPHPIYGDQLQDAAVLGVKPEARIAIRWDPTNGTYGDGTAFELISPHYDISDCAYGPLGDDVTLSGRVAPQLIGLGLLEAIPESAILAHADPDDNDGDSISGRANYVPGEKDQPARLGRFGWKAMQPDVFAQATTAFVNDMGITSSRFRTEPLSEKESASIHAVSGGGPEIDDKTLDRVVFYARALAVPAARDTDHEEVRRGRALFREFACSACHTPSFTTGDTAFHPGYVHQTIAPYTDLLLHDLGSGLSEGKRDGDVQPAEWRTPPLWGIGLFSAVNGHTRYLHDGRARNLAEAVLWHDGEAHRARERFRNASCADRDALVAFLNSL